MTIPLAVAPALRSLAPALLTTLLVAASLVYSSPAAAADRGFYFSAKIGSTDVEQSFGDAVEQLVDGDEDSLAFEAGFAFTKLLAVQLGYHDFGEVPGLLCGEGGCDGAGSPPLGVLEAETKAYSAAGVLRFPLPLGFSVFGKAGVVFFESEIDVIGDDGASEFLDDFSDEDLMLGLGARFELPGPFSVFGEWEQIAGDIETISLGVTLAF